ncbi:MAG: monovalent cation/H+ antiporter subunit D family protein [Streptosporangiales bacterium]|nr:monovalent cation/H+ antiporter subunit D family protein [Streptosporangiales bacterium]
MTAQLGWLTPEHAAVLPTTVALPVVAAFVVLLLRNKPNVRELVSLVAGVAVAALVVSLWPVVGDDLQFEMWTWLPGLSLAFRLEPLGLLFATVAGVLWPVTTLYSIGYMRGNREQRQARFYCFFALAIAAALWIAFSANLVTLFIGYEMLTLATWPLVTHHDDEKAKRGGRVYLVILLTTSICLLLPAIIWTWLIAGTTDFVEGGILRARAGPGIMTVLVFLYAFGIGKAALMPFHWWLPSAMVAPTPVSALLHAVAVVKAGVFAVLKIVIYIFGIDALRSADAATPMMWVTAFTLLVAGLVAITRDNLKARLAYSTVSQLAYIVLAAMLANDVAAAGGALHIVTHAVGKITLFFCAGAIHTAAHKTKVSELDGLGRAMPWTFGAFFIASVSIVGLPPLGGTWSKWLLLLGAAKDIQPVMVILLLLGSLLALAYLMPIPIRAFFRPPPQPLHHGEAPVACVVPLVLTALAGVALFFFPDALIAPISEVLGAP